MTVVVLASFAALRWVDASSPGKRGSLSGLGLSGFGARSTGPAATAASQAPLTAAAVDPSLTRPEPHPSPTSPPDQSSTPAVTVPPTTTAAPPPPTAPPASAPPASAAQTIARAIFAELNSERAQNGLPALRMNSDLISSAHAHNLRMAAANTMSHQLPGEPALGARITATGYSWHSAGENVAYSTVETAAEAVRLERVMYNETPPDNGHRLNILSPVFIDVGIDVVLDGPTGKMWFTEDFGAP